MTNAFTILIISFLMLINGYSFQSLKKMVTYDFLAFKPITNSMESGQYSEENMEHDENTKMIKIDAPSELKFTPYTKPNLTDIGEFEFGNYMPFVKYSVRTVTAEMIPIFEYAFLGNGITNLQYGYEIHDLLNNKYKKTYTVVDDFSKSNTPEILRRFFYESRIVFISEDGNRFLNLSILDGGKSESGEQIWGRQLDIYSSNDLIFSILNEGCDESGGNKIYDVSLSHVLFDLQGFICVLENLNDESIINYYDNIESSIDFGYEQVLRIPNNTNNILTYDREKEELRIYSLNDMRLAYIVKISENVQINQLLNGVDLLITFNNYSEFCNYTYLFNLDNLEMRYLGNYMFNPVISPDKKYITYTKTNGTGSHEFITDVNNLNEMENGFYIKNLEKDETVFYCLESTGEHGIINWVSENGLENSIGNSAYH